MTDAFDLSRTFIHLGLGATAAPMPDFSWAPQDMERYHETHASDGNEGRLVCLLDQAETWNSWERHPAGEEVVILLSGRVDLIQDRPDGEHVIELHPGEAAINPPGVWHTARVHQPGQAVFITPGRGTEVRPVT